MNLILVEAMTNGFIFEINDSFIHGIYGGMLDMA